MKHKCYCLIALKVWAIRTMEILYIHFCVQNRLYHNFIVLKYEKHGSLVCVKTHHYMNKVDEARAFSRCNTFPINMSHKNTKTNNKYTRSLIVPVVIIKLLKLNTKENPNFPIPTNFPGRWWTNMWDLLCISSNLQCNVFTIEMSRTHGGISKNCHHIIIWYVERFLTKRVIFGLNDDLHPVPSQTMI